MSPPGQKSSAADVIGELGNGGRFTQRIGENESIRVGRDPGCHWTLPFGDVEMFHFSLTWSDGRLWLAPAASVLLNGVVAPVRAPLPQKACIQFGMQVLIISYVAQDVARAASADDDERTRVAADAPWRRSQAGGPPPKQSAHDAPTRIAPDEPTDGINQGWASGSVSGPPSSEMTIPLTSMAPAELPAPVARRESTPPPPHAPQAAPPPAQGGWAPTPPPHAPPPGPAPFRPEVGNVTVIASVDELRENAQRIAAKSVAPPMVAPMVAPPMGNPPIAIQGETTAHSLSSHAGMAPATASAPFDPAVTPVPVQKLEQIFAMPTNLAEKGQHRGNATLRYLAAMFGLAIVCGAGYFAYQQMQVKSASQIRREVARTTRKPPPPADRVDDRPAVVVLQTAGDGKADERAALRQLLDGRLVEARTSYEQLAVAFPQDHRFAVMASIIQRELARRCKPGSSLVNEMCIDIASGAQAAAPSAPPPAPAPSVPAPAPPAPATP